MTATGKRHDFVIDYEVGFDDDGRIHGVDCIFAARCGFSSDLSGPVTDRALFHCDNAYFYPAVRAALGAAQHQHGVQHRLSRLRRAAGHGRRPSAASRRSPTRSARTRSRSASATSTATDDRNVTPYHQTVEDNIIHRDRRRTGGERPTIRRGGAAILAFNADSRDPASAASR